MTPSVAGKARAPITVLVVGEHPVVCAGKPQVLDAADNVAVLVEGARGTDTHDLLGEYHPDVLVPDVNLPHLSGVDVTQQLHEQGPSAAILVLTVHDNAQTIFGLSESGAAGYVFEDVSRADVFHTAAWAAGTEAFVLKDDLDLKMAQRWKRRGC